MCKLLQINSLQHVVLFSIALFLKVVPSAAFFEQNKGTAD